MKVANPGEQTASRVELCQGCSGAWGGDGRVQLNLARIDPMNCLTEEREHDEYRVCLHQETKTPLNLHQIKAF